MKITPNVFNVIVEYHKDIAKKFTKIRLNNLWHNGNIDIQNITNPKTKGRNDLQEAADFLEEFDINYEMRVISAHRTPDLAHEYAAEAVEKGMKVIGLTGKDGGKMAGLCDVEIRAPKSDYADRAQEIHIKVIHSLIDYVEWNL